VRIHCDVQFLGKVDLRHLIKIFEGYGGLKTVELKILTGANHQCWIAR
jgi:hypothetical protein